jgi:putative membrane protein
MKPTMKLRRLDTCLAAAMLGSALAMPGAWAADNEPSSQSQSGQSAQAQQAAQGQAKLSQQDRKFMMDAAQGGMLEVEASRLALERASSEQVREFAQQLLKDHTDANEKLMQIAQDKGVKLPKELDAKHKQQLSKLGKLKGEEFDRTYMQELGHKDHKKDIQAFEKQARQGKDAELRTFAEETLPVLQKHLSMAHKVSGADSAEAGGGASSGQDQKQ